MVSPAPAFRESPLTLLLVLASHSCGDGWEERVEGAIPP